MDGMLFFNSLSFVLALLSTPGGVSGDLKAGTLRSVSTTTVDNSECVESLVVFALYVMYIMNKDCILFRFS